MCIFHYIYTYEIVYTIRYYSTTIYKKILTLVTTWMDREGIILREISQTEKKKILYVSLIGGIKKSQVMV